MAENVDKEEASLRLQPFRDLFEKALVVFHVLEHLVRHDSVEFHLLLFMLELVKELVHDSYFSAVVENVDNIDVSCD